jgi:integrase
MPGYHKLSATRIARLTKPGRYGDGFGLWLQISTWKTKAWIFQYSVDGRVRQLGLGPLHTVTLAEARHKAMECRKLVREGVDPVELRRQGRVQKRVEDARAVSFRQAAERFIAAHEASWRNEKHREQWRATLDRYAYPTIGGLPIATVDTSLVLRVLEPIWTKTPETAGRVRGRIERVLDWGRARGMREGENPARWKGHLDKLLPAPRKVKTVRHHPALPYPEIPPFMTELRTRSSISARALEITILTALRTTEVISATWNEIDTVAKVWTIPAARMKAGREHRVPLSDRVIDALRGLPREDGNPYVFLGGKKGAPLSNMAMLELLRELRPGLTVHGFRSTFRDWAAETTSYPNHVLEMALAHSVSDKVEAAYRRGDLFDKRRRLMAEWTRYCDKAPMKADNVTALRPKAKAS